jgi:hypothetical protein
MYVSFHSCKDLFETPCIVMARFYVIVERTATFYSKIFALKHWVRRVFLTFVSQITLRIHNSVNAAPPPDFDGAYVFKMLPYRELP